MLEPVVVLVSSGTLSLVAVLLLALFVVVAYRSLTRHIRRSRTPWAGEVDGTVATGPDDAPPAGTAQGDERSTREQHA